MASSNSYSIAGPPAEMTHCEIIQRYFIECNDGPIESVKPRSSKPPRSQKLGSVGSLGRPRVVAVWSLLPKCATNTTRKTGREHGCIYRPLQRRCHNLRPTVKFVQKAVETRNLSAARGESRSLTFRCVYYGRMRHFTDMRLFAILNTTVRPS